MTTVLERTAAAPISWGVCEVPGWGIQLPVERVLREMSEVGLRATELGSVGYLPTNPAELTRTLRSFGLDLTGGFNSLALADAARRDETLRQVHQSAQLLAEAGATDYVTCVVSDPQDWTRPELTDAHWSQIFSMLNEVGGTVAGYGLTQMLHPHVDSLIETAAEVQRVLDNSEVRWVLDTGHLLIGGYDPVEFAEKYAERVSLVHLKDLRLDIAAQLNAGSLTLMQAVQAGLFVPLGQGDASIATVVQAMEAQGYERWYVIEQDVAITTGEPPEGEGPIRDVQRSVAFIRSLETESGS
ncbi:MAG: TIM barrel protein [Acidimicrobiaceae bacterium]|nr:TIM barrel protein [Acidimicrobiaceae bacterium]MXW76937.1 TIM barrel protein [Acidimicrobiaceae bacterium]MYA74339.1 TIM barrel protein [Acidimicrobiaceae bacterium]MYC41626.1 TIM barrel protein [Acidimicrobiaceae bacterium]MYD05600.1 TIM barrel protein [Acidimicrobiaceae bacterium]